MLCDLDVISKKNKRCLHILREIFGIRRFLASNDPINTYLGRWSSRAREIDGAN